MIESILLNQSRILPCSVYLDGQYSVQDIFLGVPCRLGYQGIEQILELELSDIESAAFVECGKLVMQSIEEARSILKNAD